jgi:putative ABC transport system permease protein
MIIFRLILQSFILASQELYNNKLRAILSLTGISIGILCIVSVLTAVDSLEKNIKGTIQSLGNNLVFIEKWPWEFKAEYPWWKYLSRPQVSPTELKLIQERSKLTQYSAYEILMQGKKVSADKNQVNGVTVSGISDDYNLLKELNFNEGRFFIPSEFYTKQGVCIVGYSVAEILFPNEPSCIGKYIKYNGDKLKIVGVLKKEGKDLLNISNDNSLYVTSGYIRKFVDEKNYEISQRLLVKPKEGVDIEELKSELAGIFRAHRKIRPSYEDNFALNQISMLTSLFDPVFALLYLVGLFIGGFSILVGGFGIANIMFVSVKERTNLIGIKKALGAKNAYVLIEFLIEAVLLCFFGGVIGLILVFSIFGILNYVTKSNTEMNFSFHVSAFNVMIGLVISIFLGIVFGIIPALRASRLNPVDAIRSN